MQPSREISRRGHLPSTNRRQARRMCPRNISKRARAISRLTIHPAARDNGRGTEPKPFHRGARGRAGKTGGKTDARRAYPRRDRAARAAACAWLVRARGRRHPRRRRVSVERTFGGDYSSTAARAARLHGRSRRNARGHRRCRGLDRSSLQRPRRLPTSTSSAAGRRRAGTSGPRICRAPAPRDRLNGGLSVEDKFDLVVQREPTASSANSSTPASTASPAPTSN